MKDAFGVALEGGPQGAFSKERASATPVRRAAFAGSPARRSKGERAVPSLAPSLRALQEWFAAAVTHPRGVTESIEERGKIGEEPLYADELERIVIPTAALSSKERIDIYRDGYRARLVECLVDDYPAVAYALGEDRFETLCHGYMAAHPSQSPNLNAFGRHMAEWSQGFADPMAPFVSDLARLEWAMVTVLHAAPAQNLSLAELSRIPPAAFSTATFTKSDTALALEFAFPVNAFFQAFRMDRQPSVPARAWSATAVFRDGATLWRMDLSPPMHALLARLFGGSTLGQALDELAASGLLTEAHGPDVMRWFRDWVGHGFFGGIQVAA